MHLKLLTLPLSTLLLSFTLALEIPTKDQVVAGKLPGRLATPPDVKHDYAVLTSCHCTRGDGAANRVRYRQIEYYNIHLDTTFFLAFSIFDISANSNSGISSIRACRKYVFGPEDKGKPHVDEFCYTNWIGRWPHPMYNGQKDWRYAPFGEHPKIHFNGKHRGFGPYDKRNQGYRIESQAAANERCRVVCPVFVGMDMMEGVGGVDGQALCFLENVDVMCPGCR
ncbi:hypothetical protein N7G274_007375 [Stereocaulon virgatum]|uniref:Uncharacterized protein n=1 Tax=Stereocaulon virgatum TaxID=373712 RepID=A0ABR4A1Z5_9LECA